jgi:hypothetical protein
MPTRILQADVRDFVKNTLLNVRLGLEDALAQGLVVELPEKVDFQLEVVSDAQTMLVVTAQSDLNPIKTETTSEGASTDTNTQGASTDTTTEGASTDSESDTRSATQGTSNSDTDSSSGSKSYQKYTV